MGSLSRSLEFNIINSNSTSRTINLGKISSAGYYRFTIVDNQLNATNDMKCYISFEVLGSEIITTRGFEFNQDGTAKKREDYITTSNEYGVMLKPVANEEKLEVIVLIGTTPCNLKLIFDYAVDPFEPNLSWCPVETNIPRYRYADFYINGALYAKEVSLTNYNVTNLNAANITVTDYINIGP